MCHPGIAFQVHVERVGNVVCKLGTRAPLAGEGNPVPHALVLRRWLLRLLPGASRSARCLVCRYLLTHIHPPSEPEKTLAIRPRCRCMRLEWACKLRRLAVKKPLIGILRKRQEVRNAVHGFSCVNTHGPTGAAQRPGGGKKSQLSKIDVVTGKNVRTRTSTVLTSCVASSPPTQRGHSAHEARQPPRFLCREGRWSGT